MNDKRDPGAFRLILRAGMVILVLLLGLSLLTSLVTGISMFDPAILKMLSTIFTIGLVILGILILGIVFAALFLSSRPVIRRQSTLIQDNRLRYEVSDGRRKYRKTFSLDNIDAYLDEYGEMYLPEHIRLFKNDKNRKSNAINLMTEFDDGKKLNLRDLNDDDSSLYNRLAAFLDKIHEKDSIALQFHLRSYVSREQAYHAAEANARALEKLAANIEDREIVGQINETIANINATKPFIDTVDYSDKYRKLFDNYLNILVDIVNNYATLEKHRVDETELNKAAQNLSGAFRLVNSALDSIRNQEDDEAFDRIEAEVAEVSQVLVQNGEQE